ncbi:MAG TPA: hypothetical protein VN661_08655 [Candidatus Acidoferrales bacterium]|nr:hypothetical protein [Candidatus Acidoferrales bacterium]
MFPLDQVKPGMKGVAYTIFSGDAVEPVNLEIIGVLRNALGPKEDVILVRLLGQKAEETGVVAGMSGSPVYVDGKLLGALSLKLGTFTKEAIGGVTPIEEMLDVERDSAQVPSHAAAVRTNTPGDLAQRVALPQQFAVPADAGGGQYLEPIATPLITTGLYPDTLARFGKQLSQWGMAVMAGGTAPATPQDQNVKPGDMVSVDLIRGDLSASAGCTITTVQADRILACGHPIYGFGSVAMPISRAHVLLTLASAMSSTKVISTGGLIGTLTQDRSTAIMGRLGAGPAMIPMEVTLTTPSAQKAFHFQVVESPQLTPLLVALAAYNGISGSPAYGEGSTLQLDGDIELKGHTPVHLEDLFAPTDTPTPNGLLVALSVQNAFTSIFSNPYEQPKIERIRLNVKAVSERRWAVIDSAWAEKSEVRPGETIAVKVLLRPYRGAPFIQEIPVTVPPQAQRGTLQLLVSDAETLNRNVQFLAANSAAQLPGLEELIRLINRERHNDRLYATLLQPTPTLLVQDKEMPNVPVSEISVLDQRRSPEGARVLYQSTAGEWSVEMHQVIAGEDTLTLTVQ